MERKPMTLTLTLDVTLAPLGENYTMGDEVATLAATISEMMGGAWTRQSLRALLDAADDATVVEDVEVRTDLDLAYRVRNGLTYSLREEV